MRCSVSVLWHDVEDIAASERIGIRLGDIARRFGVACWNVPASWLGKYLDR